MVEGCGGWPLETRKQNKRDGTSPGRGGPPVAPTVLSSLVALPHTAPFPSFPSLHHPGPNGRCGRIWRGKHVQRRLKLRAGGCVLTTSPHASRRSPILHDTDPGPRIASQEMLTQTRRARSMTPDLFNCRYARHYSQPRYARESLVQVGIGANKHLHRSRSIVVFAPCIARLSYLLSIPPCRSRASSHGAQSGGRPHRRVSSQESRRRSSHCTHRPRSSRRRPTCQSIVEIMDGRPRDMLRV